MSRRSAIEWTQMTWNPVSGCTKVSPGCLNCYAERMAKRLKAMRAARYLDGCALRTHEAALEEPLRWKSPRKVFVNSMSDLFHKDVPLEFIQRDARARLRRYGSLPSAPVPDSHEALCAIARARSCPQLGAEHLDGCQRGGSEAIAAGGRSESRSRANPFLVRRASARPYQTTATRRDSLGHRRRRVRAWCASDQGALGRRPARPMPREWRALLLQAMGRRSEASDWPHAARANVRRDANGTNLSGCGRQFGRF